MKIARVVNALIVSFAVGGCAAMSGDFEKATRLADLSLGRPDSVHRVMSLPSGSADIVLVVPNQQCKPVPASDSVRVRIAGDNVGPIERTMKFGELTWAHAKDSCDAYGYLYDKAAGLSRKFDIGADARSVSIDVEVVSSGAVRPAAVWLIYNGRAPTNRFFGNRE